MSKAIDPICGMEVEESPESLHSVYSGKTHYFCSEWCKNKFDANPEMLADPARARAASASTDAPTDVEYTCPMHPEVVKWGPGSCPICGMALEPMEFDPNRPEDDSETRDFSKRLKFAVPASVVLLALGMRMQANEWSTWIQFALASPVVLWCGLPLFIKAWESVRNRSLNMFSLIGLGVGASYLYSVFAVITGIHELYFEAAAVIVTLVLVGQILEMKARQKTGHAIRELLNLTPKTARKIFRDGVESDIPVENIKVGDRLRIRPGERVPVDGIVSEGYSSVDESLITGESFPVAKKIQDRLIGGSVNGNGAMVLKAEKVGKETYLYRIVKFVAEAQRTRAPIQSLADQLAAVFVPIVIAIASISALIWFFASPENGLSHAIHAFVSVLLIACPCALGLATPMSVVVSMGKSAGSGILFKNASAIQLLSGCDTLVLDKTGTLTQGKPTVMHITMLERTVSEDEVLSLAAAVEARSEHPLSQAIVAEAAKRKLDFSHRMHHFEAFPGRGVTAEFDRHRLQIGKKEWVLELAKIEPNQAPDLDANVWVAIDHSLVAAISVRDEVKPEAAGEVIKWKAMGLDPVMLSGDQRDLAQRVADRLGIKNVIAEVLPEQKLDVIEKLQAQGKRVIMVGDGVNDAPALAKADVGMAMSTGSDVAMETADVTLLHGDLRGVANAVEVSVLAMKNIKQNLFFAFVYNLVGVPIAAGALYPRFGILLSPMIASAAMSLSSVSVIANALRLRFQIDHSGDKSALQADEEP